MPSRTTITKGLVLLAILVAAVYVARRDSPTGGSVTVSPADTSQAADAGESRILSAFENRLSDQWVEAHGTVERLLPDDREGSRHQRFILELPSGHTVLISHNIDLADRVAGIGRGDYVAFRGEYEWNAQGGVVHWTHRDPAGQRAGGWLEHGGRRYE